VSGSKRSPSKSQRLRENEEATGRRGKLQGKLTEAREKLTPSFRTQEGEIGQGGRKQSAAGTTGVEIGGKGFSMKKMQVNLMQNPSQRTTRKCVFRRNKKIDIQKTRKKSDDKRTRYRFRPGQEHNLNWSLKGGGKLTGPTREKKPQLVYETNGTTNDARIRPKH